jgi:hypothetical protein
MTCNRSSTVWARKSVSSKIVGSGQNVTMVPVRPRGAGPTISSGPFGLPPSTNSSRWRFPSRSISSNNRVDNAFTIDTPTPWRPPETL